MSHSALQVYSLAESLLSFSFCWYIYIYKLAHISGIEWPIYSFQSDKKRFCEKIFFVETDKHKHFHLAVGISPRSHIENNLQHPWPLC